MNSNKHIKYYSDEDIEQMSNCANTGITTKVWQSHTGITTQGWYFWDETEAFAHGPFKDYITCHESLDMYAALLNNEKDEDV